MSVYFGLPAGAIPGVFRIEEELLCKAQSCNRSDVLAPPLLSLTADKGVTRVQVPGGYVFCISINNQY